MDACEDLKQKTKETENILQKELRDGHPPDWALAVVNRQKTVPEIAMYTPEGENNELDALISKWTEANQIW